MKECMEYVLIKEKNKQPCVLEIGPKKTDGHEELFSTLLLLCLLILRRKLYPAVERE